MLNHFTLQVATGLLFSLALLRALVALRLRRTNAPRLASLLRGRAD